MRRDAKIEDPVEGAFLVLQVEGPLVQRFPFPYGPHDPRRDLAIGVSDVRTNATRKLGASNQFVAHHRGALLCLVIVHLRCIHQMVAIHDHFTLDDDGNPVPEEDMIKWAKALDNIEERRVGHTIFEDRTTISTVFLGLDHSVTRHRSLLFETLCKFKGGGDQMDRYPTWAEALQGHRTYVEEYRRLHPDINVRREEIFDRPRRSERRSLWERLQSGNNF